MKETKNTRQFILLVVLTLAVLLVFWWIQPENRMKVDENVFQVEDLNSISKVQLISDTSSVTLSFSGSRWEVNGNQDADANMINVLFATLQQARPRRMVPRAMRDSLYRELEDSGVKVFLYDGSQLKKEFIAGGDAAKIRSFFADPSSKEVYVMAIPGYRVYVSGIFEMKKMGWWGKLVFGFNWANFKSLEAEFSKETAENFTVSRGRDRLGIEGMAQVDTARLHTFLDDVSLLTVDEYISEPRLKDSLQQVTPSMELLVADVGNRHYRLRLFVPEPPSPVFGIVQDSRLANFSRRKIQPLLKPKSFFRKK